MHLSPNTAKLLALVINALYGILQYADSDDATPSVDLIFGLRVIQGELSNLADPLTTRGAPLDLVLHLRNVSDTAAHIADSLANRTGDDSPLQFEKLSRLLSEAYPFTQKIMGRKIAHHLVWKTRTTFSSNLTDEISNRCITELYSTDGDCRPSPDCISAMLGTKNLANYALSRQLIYLTVASRHKLCRKALLSHFSMNSTQLTNQLTELCSNVIHEMDLFLSRVRLNDLSMLTPLQKDLLMQHVFICGQHGFVEVARPALLWMTLGQQNEKGCYPLPENDAPPEIGRRLLAAIPREGCSAHSSAVATGALTVFASFLLSPDGWADFHLADAAFTIPHQEIDEPRFAQLNWRNWLSGRDDDVPLGDPPPLKHHFTADLIAFVSLFIGIFVLLAACNQFCGRSTKQLYGYAYKKL